MKVLSVGKFLPAKTRMTFKVAACAASLEEGVRINEPGRGLEAGGPRPEFDEGELSMTADADCNPYDG